ncbi:MAG: hypothetical protein LWX23_06765 [Spirochaetia bacterium]|jgi:hypothetical protein|uniref:Uncharacterized protein n=1 Tax=uncultured Spirochaetota bacterium TaxID=460511 RepID=A0A652ZRV6_9SPIR|nr:hypothetical protein [Spirochaetia bacterium]MCE1209155.1 hypothetical protein [Spirochaetia bacterium]VBB38466.1 conserved hypothetical protein [uncultured Spirochaetota bacterium]HOI23242.1 hypothetical protein [Spirochaetales bacterium]
MKLSKSILHIVFLWVLLASLPAQPEISQKQDIAIFSLGYYGWNIPYQALGSIDGEIQKVFSDLGRFTILGVTQRFSSSDVNSFIETVKRSKQSDFVMPEKFQFGESFLTEGEFNRLIGAFIVVVPVVVEFNSYFDIKNLRYHTKIKTNITFIDIASGGSVLAIKTVESSGSNDRNQYESIHSAISSIPAQLQYEVRSIPQFQINTRILSVRGSTVKLQMGSDMGIRKGDEYAIIESAKVEGFDDLRESGLIVVKDVGREISTGEVLYKSIKLSKDTQLREIPRLGSEVDLYLHSIGDSSAGSLLPGLRATASRGFYAFRPFVAAQIPVGLISSFLIVEIFPVNALMGAEYLINLGRLSFAPSAAFGISYFSVTSPWVTTDTEFLSHVGIQAALRLAYLLGRNSRIFADLGYESWIAITDLFGNRSYSGLMIGGGFTFKL